MSETRKIAAILVADIVGYSRLKSILDNNLDRRPAQKRAADGTPILHPNIRGPRYYN
jgi:hypothetical protein